MLPNASSQSEITCKTLPSIDGASSTSQLVRTQHRWCQLDQPARSCQARSCLFQRAWFAPAGVMLACLLMRAMLDPVFVVPARPAGSYVPSSIVQHRSVQTPIRRNGPRVHTKNVVLLSSGGGGGISSSRLTRSLLAIVEVASRLTYRRACIA